MTDYSSMSDEELLALRNGRKPASSSSPVDYSSLSDAQLLELKKGNKVSGPPGYLSDLYQSGKKGLGSGLSGAGWLADRATGYGKALEDYGSGITKAAEAQISPLAKERASREYFSEAAPGEGMFGYKPNLSALAGAPYQIAESVPSMAAALAGTAAAAAAAPAELTFGAGALGVTALRFLGPTGLKLASSALGEAGVTAATAAGKSIFEAAAPAVGKAIIATLAGNASEGLMAAGMNGEQTEQILTATLTEHPEKLQETQDGLDALAEANGDIPQAIKIAAAKASGRAALLTGASTSLLATPGSLFEARMLAKGLKKSIGQEALMGGVSEGLLQEAPQSAAEQYLQNISSGAYDPSITPGQGVLNAAVQGGIAGAGMGAGIGAISSGVHGAEMSNEDLARMGRRVGQGELGQAIQDVRENPEAALQPPTQALPPPAAAAPPQIPPPAPPEAPPGGVAIQPEPTPPTLPTGGSSALALPYNPPIDVSSTLPGLNPQADQEAALLAAQIQKGTETPQLAEAPQPIEPTLTQVPKSDAVSQVEEHISGLRPGAAIVTPSTSKALGMRPEDFKKILQGMSVTRPDLIVPRGKGFLVGPAATGAQPVVKAPFQPTPYNQVPEEVAAPSANAPEATPQEATVTETPEARERDLTARASQVAKNLLSSGEHDNGYVKKFLEQFSVYPTLRNGPRVQEDVVPGGYKIGDIVTSDLVPGAKMHVVSVNKGNKEPYVKVLMRDQGMETEFKTKYIKPYTPEVKPEADIEAIDEQEQERRLEEGEASSRKGKNNRKKKAMTAEEIAFEEELAPTKEEAAPEVEAKAPVDPERLKRSREIVEAAIKDMESRGKAGKTAADEARRLLTDKGVSHTEVHHLFMAYDIASRMLGGTEANPTLAHIRGVAHDAARFRAGTKGGGIRGLIEFSLEPGSLQYIRETAFHEAFHVLQDLMQEYDPATAKLVFGKFRDGMTLKDIDPSIRRTLQMAAPEKGGQSYWDAFSAQYNAETKAGSDLRSEFGKQREAMAYMFGMLAEAKSQGHNTNSLTAPFKRFLNFIAQFRQRMGNYLRGEGYRSMQDVLNDYAAGTAQKGYGAEKAASGPEGPEYSFVGKGSKHWSKATQDKAEELEGQDVNPIDIYKQTGLHRGLRDRKWRAEVPDFYASFNPSGLAKLAKKGAKVELQELYDHAELYENYPWIGYIDVEGVPIREGEAAYYAFQRLIEVSSTDVAMAGKGLETGLKRSIVHEVQHAIQMSEGFSPGTSPDKKLKSNIADNIERYVGDLNYEMKQSIVKPMKDITGFEYDSDWIDQVEERIAEVANEYNVDIYENGYFTKAVSHAFPNVSKKVKEKILRDGIVVWDKFLNAPATKDIRDDVMAALMSDKRMAGTSKILKVAREFYNDLDDKFEKWQAAFKKDKTATFELYEGEPGERESRDTEDRLKLLSEAERRATLPGAFDTSYPVKAEGKLGEVLNEQKYLRQWMGKLKEAIDKSVPKPEEFEVLSDYVDEFSKRGGSAYFEAVNNIEVPEGIAAAEENYWGGISNLGDPEAALTIQAMPGYFDYRSDLEDAAREHLGDEFTAYRYGKISDRPLSVTLDKGFAEKFGGMAAHKGRKSVVSSVRVPAEAIIMRGRSAEGELVVDGSLIERVAAGELSKRGGANAPAGDNPFPRPPAADVAGRLRRTKKRRAEYKEGVSNGPKNERLELDDERKGMENKGKTSWIVGRITPEDWITRVEANLSNAEIQEAAQWYAQAMQAYSQYFGKDWPKYLAAWLMANQQASPATAQMNAIRAREKVLSKSKTGPRAGLAEARLLPFWNALENGGELPLGGAQKLYDFIDSGLLRDTRSWMHDDPEAGAPAVADVHSLRDAGFVDETLHKVLVKKYGDQAKDIPIDIGGSPSEAQYEKAADFLREVTDYLNATNYMEHKWTPAEVQAVGWMSTSKFTGNQGQTPFEAIVRNIRDLNYELGFGEGAPYNDKFPDLAKLPTIGQKEVVRDVLNHVTDFVVKATGLKEIGRVQATGGWLSDNVEQNMRLQTVASPEAMVDAANMIGWITQQTGMLPYRLLPLKAKPGGEKFALRIYPSTGNALASDEMMGALWQKLRKADLKKSGAKDAPAIIQGYSTHEVNGNAAMLIMFDGGGEKLRGRIQSGDIKNVLDKISSEMGIDLDLELLRHESDYRQNKWKEDKDGEGYLQGLRKRYGPDIQKRLRDYQRSEFEPRLGKALAAAKSKYGLRPETDALEAPEGGFQNERSVRGGSELLAPSGRANDEPLEGLPRDIDVPGLGRIKAGPSVRIRRVAQEYMRRAGFPYNPPTKYVKVDVERATRIADAYDQMKNNPSDPRVKAAYEQMAKETLAQWEAIKADGFTAEFYPEDFDPYPDSPRLVIEDINRNNHMYVFPTEDGYGETGISDKDREANPMLQETGEFWNGKPVLVNDVFRAVHDYFGHAKEGVGFRGAGEENAWRSHISMYSPFARLAATSELRGQNSWLNYGINGEKNRTAKLADTIFADQKLGILPDWVQYEGAEDILGPISEAEKADFSKRGGVEEGEKAIARAAQVAASKAVTGWGKVKKFLVSTFDPLAELPEREQYLLMRYRTLGNIDALEREAKGFYEIIKKATKPQKEAIYAYLTTRGAPVPVLPAELRDVALKVKTRINQIGADLLGRKIISPQSVAMYKDRYLPRLYMKYLLEEKGIAGTGIGVGKQKYLWERKSIGVEERIAMGEVVDPSFLSFAALYRPARDNAILDFLEGVATSSGTDWVMPDQLIDWKGSKVTAFWLSDESKNIRERMIYEPDAAKKAIMARVADQMQTLADPHLNQMTTENYKRLPTSNRYGALKGLAVRKEIYNDIVATGGFDPDPNMIDRIFGDKNSSLARGTQFWKMTKTILNLPTQARNFISNAVMLNLSGVPPHMVAKRMLQAMEAMSKNGYAWQVAKKYGIEAGGFNENELRDAQQVLRDYLSSNTTGIMNPKVILNVLAKITDKAGNAYQWSEMLFKTAKIIDELERKGVERMPTGAAKDKAEGLAALEGHKWFFDYSLVPRGIKSLRTMPFGAPFITYYYKALPLMAEVLMNPKTAFRFAPYIALQAALPILIASMYDVDDDDVDKLKMTISEALRDKPSLLIIPFKDQHNRWQLLDAGYFFPWSMFLDTALKISKGNVMGALGSVGALSSPALSVVTAMKTNIDPFTNKEIVNPLDPPMEKVKSLLNYVNSVVSPPMLTSYGVVGKAYDALTNSGVNKYGEPNLSATQITLRAFGINVTPLDPMMQRSRNIQHMQNELTRLKGLRSQRLHDKSLTSEDRAAINQEYADEYRKRAQELRDYVQASNIPEKLR